MKMQLFKAALTAGLFIPALNAQADTSTERFVQIAATLRAGAEVCNNHTTEKLDELRAQQQAAVSELGMSAQQFDKVFTARLTEMRSMLAQATPDEITEVCEDLDNFPIEQWR